MPRKSEIDERQNDFFGTPDPAPSEPKPPVRKTLKAQPQRAVDPADNQPKSFVDDTIEKESVDIQVSRMSSAELRGLAAIISDETLAELTVATIRELQRRLTRSRQPGRNGQKPILERAARQLTAELGTQNDDYDF